jgi:hypothetical protein
MTSRYRFISAHRATYGVTRLCRVLRVRRQGFYEYLDAAAAREQRQQAEDALAAEIAAIHVAHKRAYGSPRVTVELRRRGRWVNRKRVERIMRQRGIVGATRRRRWTLTQPDVTAPPAPDLIGRDFTATAPGEKLVGDITYLPTEQGWLYLATVIDLHTREIVGHAMADHMRADLVCDAVELAARRGLIQPDAIFHSDRGSQGEFNRLSQHLVRGGVRWAGTRSWGGCSKGGGSGRRIGRCGRRCGRRVGLSPRVRCSGSSGG